MAKLVDLAAQDWLRPCDLKRFGNRVKLFHPTFDYTKNDDCYEDGMKRLEFQIKEELEAYPCEVYTAKHSDCDWDTIIGWQRGWHIVNRTGDYAVIRDSCELCAFQTDCSLRGDGVSWCAEFSRK